MTFRRKKTQEHNAKIKVQKTEHGWLVDYYDEDPLTRYQPPRRGYMEREMEKAEKAWHRRKTRKEVATP